MESLGKQANKCDPLLFFFYKWVSMLVMHFYAFCKTWCVVEHGVECYFWSFVLVSLRSLPSHIEVNF